MTEYKKLNKEQRRSIYSLFIEYASIPMLILATTVLFSALSTFNEPFQRLEISTLFLCVTAIPLLGISIFVKKALQIYDNELNGV